MRKQVRKVGFVLALAMALCMNAYADEATTGEAHGSDFIAAVGGFFYNALPWNWGNWWGK